MQSPFNLIFSAGSNIFKFLIVCLAAVLGIVLFSMVTNENLSIEEANIKMVEKIMPKLPIQASETTTWVSIKADKKTIIYGYKFSSNSDQINLKGTEQKLRKEIRDSLCRGKYLDLLKRGIIYKYVYNSADQKKVFDIIFIEENCLQSGNEWSQ